MKSYVIILTLAISLKLAFGGPSSIEIREDRAFQECNNTYIRPVLRNPRKLVAIGIATGNRIKLTSDEKCVLLCFLQKVNFLDEEANIQSVGGLVNHTLRQIPELAKYSDVLYAHIFQTSRSMKEFYDKCQQAFVTYHYYALTVFVLGMADSLEKVTGIRDEVIQSVEKGHLVEQKQSQKVIQFLSVFDRAVSSLASER